jgi:putative N6-adenine-specific DNA methylase/tRNA (guanine6-N2)-methyltransferase
LSDEPHYLLTTDPGIEDLAAEELCERLPAASAQPLPYGLPGQVRAGAASLDALLSLRTIRQVIEIRLEAGASTLDDLRRLVGRAELPELSGAESFRVTTEWAGVVGATRREIQGAAGAVLQGRYGTRVDLERPQYRVRVEVCGNRMVAGLQRTERSLSKRLVRARPLRSSIRPTLAAAMLRLAGAQRGGGRLIDPMCGAGTIPIEARQLNAELEVHASDWDPKTLQVARATAARHGCAIDFRLADARALGRSYATPFDSLVTDPPYGVRQAKRSSSLALYRSLLPSFEAVLAESGRIVLVALKPKVFRLALEATALELLHERRVRAGSLELWMVVLAHR